MSMFCFDLIQRNVPEQNIDDAVVPVLDIQSVMSISLPSFLPRTTIPTGENTNTHRYYYTFVSFLSQALTKNTPNQPTDHSHQPIDQPSNKKKHGLHIIPSLSTPSYRSPATTPAATTPKTPTQTPTPQTNQHLPPLPAIRPQHPPLRSAAEFSAQGQEAGPAPF